MPSLRETGLSEAPTRSRRSIEARVGADPGIVVWEVDGTAVALAGASVSSPGIARVGPVYTPPEHRRRGYATSLVAAWTAQLLGRGMRRCVLFTDLANPTSNSIYQAVGYRPCARRREIDFVYRSSDPPPVRRRPTAPSRRALSRTPFPATLRS